MEVGLWQKVFLLFLSTLGKSGHLVTTYWLFAATKSVILDLNGVNWTDYLDSSWISFLFFSVATRVNDRLFVAVEVAYKEQCASKSM